MHPPDEELRKAVALFRYGLIADVLRLAPGSAEIRRTLNEKAQRTYVIPGTRRSRVAVETMRDWLTLYRNGGFEALYPKTRSDRGLPRRLPPEAAEVLVSLKSEQPALSVKALIKAARERGIDHPLAPSTVHRLLSREGLLDARPGDPAATDRRRFAYRDAGELWMSDVMHGPKVADGRRRRKTYLIAFIDDATRVIPFRPHLVLGRLIAIRRAETVGLEPQRCGQCAEMRIGEGAQRSQRDVGVEPRAHRAHLGDAPGELFGQQPDDDTQDVMDETDPALDPAHRARELDRVAAKRIGHGGQALRLLGVGYHRLDLVELARKPRGQTVRQPAEGGVALTTVPASDLCPTRGLARVGAVACERTAAVGVIRTTLQPCSAPRLGLNVLLAG